MPRKSLWVSTLPRITALFSRPVSWVVGTALICCPVHANALIQAESARPNQVRIAPSGKVCVQPGVTTYPNFDILITNGTSAPLEVGQITALVMDMRGQVIERRLLWSDALSVIAPDRVIASGATGLVFNPFAFNRIPPQATLRYALDLYPPGAVPISSLGVSSAGHVEATMDLSPQRCVPRTRLRSPLRNRVVVLDGQDFYSHHRRFNYLPLAALGFTSNVARFALDLTSIEADGRMFDGQGRQNQDWLAWGQTVVAPAAGIVAAVHNAQPDNTLIGKENLWNPATVRADLMSIYGNYVVVDHQNGEFSLLAHLRKGSVTVVAGQAVNAGQVVGAVGNSGSSLLPHLHYELRSGAGIRDVESLPVYLHDTFPANRTSRAGRSGVAFDTGDIFTSK